MFCLASYYLYQIYTEEEDLAEAEKYKSYVLKNHPDSRYAAGIINPGKAIDMEDTAENSYKRLYALFEAGEFEQVLQLGKNFAEQFNDDDLLPKIELLTATATGRLYGFEAYKKQLNEVALNYPQTEEGKKAQDLLTTALPRLESDKFNFSGKPASVKLLYSFPASQKDVALQLKQKIDSAITSLNYKNYSTSLDVYNIDTTFVAVHGLENPERAGGFAELLQVNKSYEIEKEPVVISTENYRVLQLHKNFQAYLEQQNNP
ncbi:hypothetical protein LZ575_15250 [Antarcticibacterium sp. 1MA-6-2]|uniref:hypothetical protein n=1 Tax=Antarcticibacterium sp. 1MA-6-2 TaxID=2908210 RepID=UPI001F208A9D|nr:hypothetical protein [Antarcticibacterium sp. 1MA-6-2]UJH90228.1 hypothetical protein LZ575_15250 [Antarcticibacterium sp. 1MA-6-2]